MGTGAAQILPPFTAELERRRMEMRELIAAELRPHAAEWERAGMFPDAVFSRLAQAGLLGLKYPQRYGGSDLGYLPDAILCEELARCGSGGVAAGIGAHIGIATPPVWKFGSPSQHERYLVPAIRGELIGALAITEPDAGSDVASIRTRAVRDGDGFLVNGSKTFITNGVRAGFLVTAVRTTAAGGHHGISFLIVEPGEGVSATPLRKLGWHASDTAMISFEDVWVPLENLLGEENGGFRLIMANFQWERLLMALGAVGAMEAGIEGITPLAASLGGQRRRHELAWMATRLEGARAITLHALRLFVAGLDAVREVTMAKLATQRSCFEVLDGCLQIAYDAGAGAESLAELERAVRDARLGPIGGGTDEIMREILGRALGL